MKRSSAALIAVLFASKLAIANDLKDLYELALSRDASSAVMRRSPNCPAPRPERVEWAAFAADLARQQPFVMAAPLPESSGWFDRVQVEQALINLLKNAHEAGGADAQVEVLIMCVGTDQRIEVRDRGAGMSQTVLSQALLPFYSTKRSGTGLGLALAREIAEAYGGRIHLANRDGGALSVVLDLPLAPR